MTIPPTPGPRAGRSRPALQRTVSAATQLVTAAAITATGTLVGVLGQQARLADAQRAAAAAAPKTQVAPNAAPRPVRTVVVRKLAPAVPPPVLAADRTGSRRTQRFLAAPAPARPARQRSVPRPVAAQVRPAAPAPQRTQSAPVTKTTGS